jgi:heme oxygenase (biliverdin-IX-beta and delta-forming)
MLLSEKLKASTREIHATLEKGLVSKIRSINSADDYFLLLQLFYGFYKPVNALCSGFQFPQNVEISTHSHHVSLLYSDLTTMDKRSSEKNNFTEPEINNYLHALGALYVMKGSMLGGKVISDMIRKKLGNMPDSFFSSGGQDVTSTWQSFKQSIDNINDPDQQDFVVQGALNTFESFGDWINKYNEN